MNIYALESCPVCRNNQLTDFFNLRDVPVHVGFLYPSKEQAWTAPRGDITLTYCHACNYIWNKAFEDEKVEYGPGYDASLHHSAVYDAFLDDVVKRLVDQFDLHNRTLVEIGCGSGHFLRKLCRAGDNVGFGIDPSIDVEIIDNTGPERIRLIRDVYSTKYSEIKTSLICARHVLHVLSKPLQFMQILRQGIGRWQEPAVYVEVPNASHIFGQDRFWNVFYEQVGYYCRASLIRLFHDAGFYVLNASPCYDDDQYLAIEARPDVPGTVPVEVDTDIQGQVATFSSNYQTHTARLKTILNEARQEEKKCVLWGSGGRGITFLNALDTPDLLPFVVDINPDRQGLYVPGTGQQVVPPAFLQTYQPDYILISNPTYTDEIRRQVHELGLNPQYVEL